MQQIIMSPITTLGTASSVHIAFFHENRNWRVMDWFVSLLDQKRLKNNLHANDNSFPGVADDFTEAPLGMTAPSSGHFLF